MVASPMVEFVDVGRWDWCTSDSNVKFSMSQCRWSQLISVVAPIVLLKWKRNSYRLCFNCSVLVWRSSAPCITHRQRPTPTHTPQSSCTPCSHLLNIPFTFSSLKGADSLYFLCMSICFSEVKIASGVTHLLQPSQKKKCVLFSMKQWSICVCVWIFSKISWTLLSWGTRSQWQVLSSQTTEKKSLWGGKCFEMKVFSKANKESDCKVKTQQALHYCERNRKCICFISLWFFREPTLIVMEFDTAVTSAFVFLYLQVYVSILSIYGKDSIQSGVSADVYKGGNSSLKLQNLFWMLTWNCRL